MQFLMGMLPSLLPAAGKAMKGIASKVPFLGKLANGISNIPIIGDIFKGVGGLFGIGNEDSYDPQKASQSFGAGLNEMANLFPSFKTAAGGMYDAASSMMKRSGSFGDNLNQFGNSMGSMLNAGAQVANTGLGTNFGGVGFGNPLNAFAASSQNGGMGAQPQASQSSQLIQALDLARSKKRQLSYGNSRY